MLYDAYRVNQEVRELVQASSTNFVSHLLMNRTINRVALRLYRKIRMSRRELYEVYYEDRSFSDGKTAKPGDAAEVLAVGKDGDIWDVVKPLSRSGGFRIGESGDYFYVSGDYIYSGDSNFSGSGYTIYYVRQMRQTLYMTSLESPTAGRIVIPTEFSPSPEDNVYIGTYAAVYPASSSDSWLNLSVADYEATDRRLVFGQSNVLNTNDAVGLTIDLPEECADVLVYLCAQDLLMRPGSSLNSESFALFRTELRRTWNDFSDWLGA